MMCEESCAKTVREILAAQEGVRDVVVQFDQRQATCQVDPRKFKADAAIAELADQDFVATVR
jgi:copper chaperone CopZ